MYNFDVGFIVEGHTEYECYPSFIAKIIGYNPNAPIVNAGSVDNLIVNLDDNLLQLVRYKKPKKVIVTFDLKDAIDKDYGSNCIEIKELLNQKATEWISSQKEGGLSGFLPEEIIIVLVDKMLETWIISDLEGLKNCELIDENKITETFTDVDVEVNHPASWISSKTNIQIDIKNKRYRKKFGSSINPNIGKDYSRSFRKFHKEVYNNHTIYEE